MFDTEHKSADAIVEKCGEDFIIMTFIVSLHNIELTLGDPDLDILKDNVRINKASASNFLSGLLYFNSVVNTRVFSGRLFSLLLLE